MRRNKCHHLLVVTFIKLYYYGGIAVCFFFARSMLVERDEVLHTYDVGYMPTCEWDGEEMCIEHVVLHRYVRTSPTGLSSLM